MAAIRKFLLVKQHMQIVRNKVCHPSFCSTPDTWSVVSLKEVQRFIEDCMKGVGTRPSHATALAQNLVAADHRGHYSHGLNRLDYYIGDIQNGITSSYGEPSILRESAATAHVNGNNVLGPVVGNFCMDLAMKKAKQSGVGWVTAKGTNHIGIAAWYSMQASQQGFLGMAFTNTSPLSVPTRSKKPTLGTNPLSLAAPGRAGDDFVLDMSTTTVSLGKIELCDRKGLDIPNSWGVDKHGKECNNPRTVIDTGGLMMVGGSELTGGYKGYGLAMLVEVFCGILSGSKYGPNIRRWRNVNTVANQGQCYIAIDPECFEPGFRERMADLMKICRSLEPAVGETEVLVAGDPEKNHMDMCDRRGGIPYHPNQIQYGIVLAKTHSVKEMAIL